MELAAKAPPTPVPGGSGTVLVVFRTSEQGGVIDMRLIGGSPEMQRSSEDALSQWKFKPMLNGNGQPMEVFSAVIFDFSGDHPSMTMPKPMTAAQLSPALGHPCSNAIAHETPDAVSLCKKQLDAIVQDPRSTKMERFTAYDEYGVARRVGLAAPGSVPLSRLLASFPSSTLFRTNAHVNGSNQATAKGLNRYPRPS